MSGDVMLIDGITLEDPMNDYIPPDVTGLDEFGLGTLRQMLPSTDELKQTGLAGIGVAGGLVGGLGLERLVSKNLPSIPKATYPLIHLVIGAAAGRLVAGMSQPLGVGVASGFAGLAIVRALQSWLKLDISLSGLEGADLSDLADLMAADDLLPPELQNVLVEDQPIAALPDYGPGYDPVGQVAVEEVGLSGWPTL
jgi:hypothetical protein